MSLETLASLVDETPTLTRPKRDFYTTTLVLRMEEVIERGIELSCSSKAHDVRDEGRSATVALHLNELYMPDVQTHNLTLCFTS